LRSPSMATLGKNVPVPSGGVVDDALATPPFAASATLLPLLTGAVVKLAVSLIGPFMVTLAGLVAPVKEPDPLPLQPLKPKPSLGDAEIGTLWPLLNQPLDGLTLPPVAAFIVRKRCCVKFAVYVVLLVGETECEIPPPSLQLLHRYRVPPVTLCGVIVLIVWLEPEVHVNGWAPVKVLPSTVYVSPDGLV